MSLTSENSTPMEKGEITVVVVGAGDVNGNIIGSASSPPPSPYELIISEEQRRRELHQVICRLIEMENRSAAPDPNELMDTWNRVKRLDEHYGTIKLLSGRYFCLLLKRSVFYAAMVWDATEQDQVSALTSEVPDCLAKESSAIYATNRGMSLKEFLDLMNNVDAIIPFGLSLCFSTRTWGEAIEIWSNIKKLEEFERSFFPHECRGMVESLRTKFISRLRARTSVLMSSSDLRSMAQFLALLKEVNGDKGLEGSKFASGFADDLRAVGKFNFENHGVAPSDGLWQGQASMSSKEICSLSDRISETKIRYCQMKAVEIGEVRDIWNSIMSLREDECFYRKYYLNVEVLIFEFNYLLEFFIGNEMMPKDLTDFSFKEGCHQLLRQVNVYTDLEGAWSSVDSVGQASSNGGISILGDLSHSTVSGNRLSEQVAKLKSFDKFAQWATALFLAILIGLTAVNVKQAQFLFRSCSSLVFGATISGIGMLLLVLMGHSSPRVLSSLKILQYLIIGLLFITATQVYMFTLM